MLGEEAATLVNEDLTPDEHGAAGLKLVHDFRPELQVEIPLEAEKQRRDVRPRKLVGQKSYGR